MNKKYKLVSEALLKEDYKIVDRAYGDPDGDPKGKLKVEMSKFPNGTYSVVSFKRTKKVKLPDSDYTILEWKGVTYDHNLSYEDAISKFNAIKKQF